MSRLTVIARTGLRMKISVKLKFMVAPMLVRPNFDRLAWLLLLRRRIGAVGWKHGVVDNDRGAVLELHLSAGDDLCARLHALEDCHLVAASGPRGDEDLLRSQRGLALVVLLVRLLDDEDSVS